MPRHFFRVINIRPYSDLESQPHSRTTAEGVKVIAGEHSFRSFDESEQERNALQSFIHPGYDRAKGNQQNGIALVKLDEKLEFGHYVQPACLPSKGQ